MKGWNVQAWAAFVGIVSVAATAIAAAWRRVRRAGQVRVETFPVDGIRQDYRTGGDAWVKDAVLTLFNDGERDVGVSFMRLDLRGRDGKRARGLVAGEMEQVGTVTAQHDRRVGLALSLITGLAGWDARQDAPVSYRIRVRLGNGRWVHTSWTELPPPKAGAPSSARNSSDSDF